MTDEKAKAGRDFSRRSGAKPSPHDRRPVGREESAAGLAGFLLGALRELEKPLTQGDSAALKVGFSKILDRLRPLKLAGIDAIDDFDARTRLFTALLRAGRQPPSADEAKEGERRALLETTAEVWRALGDLRRAAIVFEAAGHPEFAIEQLEREGDWEGAVALAERGGQPALAARICEAHGERRRALAFLRAAGEGNEALRLALDLGALDEARAIAREINFKSSRALLFRFGQEDLYLELLAEAGDWAEISRLYERAGQWRDAALACERVGWFRKAADLFAKAQDGEQARRLARKEAASRLERGDLAGAGEFLLRFGLRDEAIDLVREKRPELAFKWLTRAGDEARAKAFAVETVERMRRAGDGIRTAIWLERAGDGLAAAEAWLEAQRPEDALRLFEQLGAWSRAAQAALLLKKPALAIECFRRAGVEPPAELLSQVKQPDAELTAPEPRAVTADAPSSEVLSSEKAPGQATDVGPTPRDPDAV